MAKGDVFIKKTGGKNSIPTLKMQTEAAATAILAGEPVKLKAAGSAYVIPMADAEPVIGTTTQVMGIAAGPSVHTSAADGYIDVYEYKMGVVYAAKAKSSAAVDTQAEIDALQNDTVLFDLTTGTYTVDTAATAVTSGLRIVGGDTERGLVYFEIRQSAAESAVA